MADAGVTIDREKVLQVLRDKSAEIEERYGIRMIGLVGSVARGEATGDSDIDVVVDIVRTPSLFQIAGAEIELQEALGMGAPVDLVLREDMRPSRRAYIERDLVVL